MESGSLVVVLPQRRRGASPDHQLLRRHRSLRRHRRLHDLDADRARLVQRPVPGDGRGRRTRAWAGSAWRGRTARHPEALARSVQDRIAEVLGKPLRPEGVRFVTQLPKTRNAKILRRVIRGAYLGRSDLGDLSSVENPAAIDEIRATAIGAAAR